jgi:hypothetical protein
MAYYGCPDCGYVVTSSAIPYDERRPDWVPHCRHNAHVSWGLNLLGTVMIEVKVNGGGEDDEPRRALASLVAAVESDDDCQVEFGGATHAALRRARRVQG